MDIKLKYRAYVGEKHLDIASKLIDNDIERFAIEFSEHLLEQLHQYNVSGSVLEQIRQAFADYRRSEGCSCCRDMDAHEEAEKRLSELLKPEPYEDGSGWDWSKYCS